MFSKKLVEIFKHLINKKTPSNKILKTVEIFCKNFKFYLLFEILKNDFKSECGFFFFIFFAKEKKFKSKIIKYEIENKEVVFKILPIGEETKN